MNCFSERLKLAQEYEEWLKKNPLVKDCPLSVIGFLEGIGILEDRTERDKSIREKMVRWP